jgi:Ala-tRNA(Pro) deacylase
MAVAGKVARFLEDHHAPFDLLHHKHAITASSLAKAGKISGERLAKAVVLKGKHGFALAVLPASRRLLMSELNRLLGEELDLANEEEVEVLFSDCDPGAVPPLADAYGLQSVVDAALDDEPEIYFEGGDHESLVHVKGEVFHDLMAKARRGRFSEPL